MTDSNDSTPGVLTRANTSLDSRGPATPSQNPAAAFTVGLFPYIKEDSDPSRLEGWQFVGWDINVLYSVQLSAECKATVEFQLAWDLSRIWAEHGGALADRSEVFRLASKAEDEVAKRAGGMLLADDFAPIVEANKGTLCQSLTDALPSDQDFQSLATGVDIIIDTSR